MLKTISSSPILTPLLSTLYLPPLPFLLPALHRMLSNTEVCCYSFSQHIHYNNGGSPRMPQVPEINRGNSWSANLAPGMEAFHVFASNIEKIIYIILAGFSKLQVAFSLSPSKCKWLLSTNLITLYIYVILTIFCFSMAFQSSLPSPPKPVNKDPDEG